jgi:hypothetical protein
MDKLLQLEKARDEIRNAAGSWEDLDRAFTNLENTFTGLTGMASTRQEGKTYGSRTLLYEDCRRDIEIEIGSEILESLAPPLTLALTSGRWLSLKAATEYAGVFEEVYRSLVAETGSRRINAAKFWVRTQSELLGPHASLGEQLISDYQKRWWSILRIEGDQQRVSRTAEQLRPLVNSAFYAPHSGWQSARYHSPDVMIVAPSVEAIRDGNYSFVLGELHAAVHTLSTKLFVSQHPSPQDLYKAIDIDLPRPVVKPVLPKSLLGSRGTPVLVSPKDYYLELWPDSPSPPHARKLRLGSLVVEEERGNLIVRSLDGSLETNILEVFAELLTRTVVNIFQLMRPDKHSPRVEIDKLVIARETWRFPAGEIEFAFEKEESQRFKAVRRWVRETGLPRFVFVKAPVEMKPCFVDFESPILTTILARLIRRTAEASYRRDGLKRNQSITITEMLPGPGEVWLPDAQGNLYASELRIVAFDLGSDHSSSGHKAIDATVDDRRQG